MSKVLKLRSVQSNSTFNFLDTQRGILEKELSSLVRNINTNVSLIEELEQNIVNLKKGKVVVSIKEYKKILSELNYLNNNLAALINVRNKNEKELKVLQKITQKKEGKLLYLPIKKAKRKRNSKKTS